MNNKRLLNVGFIVLIDMLGFALIVPLLTFFADSFGVSAFQTGLLSARFKESDLLVAFLTFAGVGLTSWTHAPTIPLLLVAMPPLAIGAGSFNTVD